MHPLPVAAGFAFNANSIRSPPSLSPQVVVTSKTSFGEFKSALGYNKVLPDGMALAVIVEGAKEEDAAKGGEGEEKEGTKREKVEVKKEAGDEEGKRGDGERVEVEGKAEAMDVDGGKVKEEEGGEGKVDGAGEEKPEGSKTKEEEKEAPVVDERKGKDADKSEKEKSDKDKSEKVDKSVPKVSESSLKVSNPSIDQASMWACHPGFQASSLTLARNACSWAGLSGHAWHIPIHPLLSLPCLSPVGMCRVILRLFVLRCGLCVVHLLPNQFQDRCNPTPCLAASLPCHSPADLRCSHELAPRSTTIADSCTTMIFPSTAAPSALPPPSLPPSLLSTHSASLFSPPPPISAAVGGPG